MGFVGDVVGGIFGGGGDPAQAGYDAANQQAFMQRQALQYMKEQEKIPQQMRQNALKQLGGLYGLQGGDWANKYGPLGESPGVTADLYGESPGVTDLNMTGQQEMIDQARNSPLYGAIMGGRKAGEDAIMRKASATGGLRSGNVQENLYDYNTQLQNQALLKGYDQARSEEQTGLGLQRQNQAAQLQEYYNQGAMQTGQENRQLQEYYNQLSGLQGLMGLPSNVNAIAQQTSNIGQTLGQGIIGAEQSQQASNQQGWNNLLGLGGLFF